MSIRILSVLVYAALLLGCASDEVGIRLNPDQELLFSGSFATNGSDENLSESVTLKIFNGRYECTTGLPFGYGAGKLDVRGDRVTFIDTVFFAVPAIFGPSYVLSGEHEYEFDGETIEIWREKNEGGVNYRMKLVK